MLFLQRICRILYYRGSSRKLEQRRRSAIMTTNTNFFRPEDSGHLKLEPSIRSTGSRLCVHIFIIIVLVPYLFSERFHRSLRIRGIIPTATIASLFGTNLRLIQMLEFLMAANSAFFYHFLIMVAAHSYGTSLALWKSVTYFNGKLEETVPTL